MYKFRCMYVLLDSLSCLTGCFTYFISGNEYNIVLHLLPIDKLCIKGFITKFLESSFAIGQFCKCMQKQPIRSLDFETCLQTQDFSVLIWLSVNKTNVS